VFNLAATQCVLSVHLTLLPVIGLALPSISKLYFIADKGGFVLFYIHVTVHRNKFILNNQPDALINQIYSVIKLYVFRASSLPIIRSSLLYIRHW